MSIPRRKLILACRLLSPVMLLLCLAAVVLPALPRARPYTGGPNMKQIVLAMQMYSQDYEAPVPLNWKPVIELYAGRASLSCPVVESYGIDDSGFLYLPPEDEQEPQPLLLERVYNHLDAFAGDGWLIEVYDRPRNALVLWSDGSRREFSYEEMLALDEELRAANKPCYDWYGTPAYPTDRLPDIPERIIRPGALLTIVLPMLLTVVVLYIAFLLPPSPSPDNHSQGKAR